MFKWKHRCFELEYKLECEEAMVVNLLKERNALIAKNAELNASNIRLESQSLGDKGASTPPQLRWGFFCSNSYKFHTHFPQFLLQAYLFPFLQFCHLLKHVHNLPLNYEVFLYYVL